MKEIDVAAVFCEMLSGFAALFIVVAALEVGGQTSLADVFTWLEAHPNFGAIAGILVAAYLVGIVVDAFGMAFDRLMCKLKWFEKFLCYDACQIPDAFYSTATEHRLKYFSEQWTFFSCYRNLLMLAPLWVTAAVVLTARHGGFYSATMVAVIGLLISIALVQSIRMLQRFMVTVTK